MKDSTETTVRDITFSSAPSGSAAISIWSWLLLWSLFVIICFDLGYPTLNRYQPSRVEGLSDSAIYYQMVTGTPSNRVRAEIFQGRILVPYVARPVYRLAQSRLHTWDAAYFALLVSNSLFCATTALLLVSAGLVVTKNVGTALVGGTLYLLNFAVPNLQLAGLVDSGEACFMMLLVWALLTGRWWLLPLAGIGGALAKETFVVFASVFAVVWWLRSEPRPALRSRNFACIPGLVLFSELTTVGIHFVNEGKVIMPWQVAAMMNSNANYLQSFLRCIFNRSFWYVWLWLLPLGVWHWKRLPREWVTASLATALVALALGIYNDMEGTVARPMFNVAGPMLALGAAMMLTGLLVESMPAANLPASE
jgi:hypothetical protein